MRKEMINKILAVCLFFYAVLLGLIYDGLLPVAYKYKNVVMSFLLTLYFLSVILILISSFAMLRFKKWARIFIIIAASILISILLIFSLVDRNFKVVMFSLPLVVFIFLLYKLK